MRKRDAQKYFVTNETKRWSKKLSWSQYAMVTDLIEQVDFGCNFENGRCNPKRFNLSKHNISKNGFSPCCCTGCASNWNSPGYIDQIPVNKTEEIMSYFDARKGFWRPGKGCILPRKYRSWTCNTFICGELGRELCDSKPWRTIFLLTRNDCEDEPVSDKKLKNILQETRQQLVELGYIKNKEEK